MPIRKFKSVEAMSQPTWRHPGDPALYAAIAAVWARARDIRTARFTPGVRRFRDIATLEAAADAVQPVDTVAGTSSRT